MLHESDLMVGVSHQGFHQDMERVVKEEIRRLREILIAYSAEDPGYFSSLDPLESVAGIREILGCAIIFETRIGIRGDLEVKLLTSEE